MKYLILAAAALTTLSTATPVPAPAIPTGLPTESNSLTICRDGWSRCEVQFNFVSSPQPYTRKIGCLNIDNTQKKMAIHPSGDLKCALFFEQNCWYGDDKTVQGKWMNVFEGLEAPGIDSFDTEWWKAHGFISYGAYGQPPKSVLCWPKKGAVGLGGDH